MPERKKRFMVVIEKARNFQVTKVVTLDKEESRNRLPKNKALVKALLKGQREFLIGKQYEARKHVHGTNQHTITRSDQSGHSTHGRIKEQIAKEQGVGQGTATRRSGTIGIRNNLPGVG